MNYWTNLYLSNLHPNTTPRGLRRVFSDFGEVLDVQVKSHKNDSGESRTFGFVRYKRAKDASKAVRVMKDKRENGSVKFSTEYAHRQYETETTSTALQSTSTNEHLDEAISVDSADCFVLEDDDNNNNNKGGNNNGAYGGHSVWPTNAAVYWAAAPRSESHPRVPRCASAAKTHSSFASADAGPDVLRAVHGGGSAEAQKRMPSFGGDAPEPCPKKSRDFEFEFQLAGIPGVREADADDLSYLKQLIKRYPIEKSRLCDCRNCVQHTISVSPSSIVAKYRPPTSEAQSTVFRLKRIGLGLQSFVASSKGEINELMEKSVCDGKTLARVCSCERCVAHRLYHAISRHVCAIN